LDKGERENGEKWARKDAPEASGDTKSIKRSPQRHSKNLKKNKERESSKEPSLYKYYGRKWVYYVEM
jgi:hypothetical protein